MAKSPNDYYRVLQVDSAAEPEVIKAAYHRLAEKYHPDKASSPDALTRMQEINEAYEILSDTIKRAEYDRKRMNFQPSISQSSHKETTTMAKLNFDELKIKHSKVADVLPSEAKGALARRPDGHYEFIFPQDAKRRNLDDYSDIIINLTDIEKAGRRRELLERDLLLFHSRFTSAEVEVYPDKGSLEYILIRNFPLPETYTTRKEKVKYYSSPTEDIVVVLTGYPDNGPYGVHIRHDSTNREQIQKALRGKNMFYKEDHVFPKAIGSSDDTSELEILGWDWICFHYAGDWDFRPNNINEGDCLAKYFINLYVALSGEFPDEDD